MHTTSIVQAPSLTLASGITIPDSKMAREITELVRDTENSLLFNHSSRVYYFFAATGKRKGLAFDPELLYTRDAGPQRATSHRVAPPLCSTQRRVSSLALV